MEWPTLDPHASFEDVEEKLGITKEANDVRKTALGAHPSDSYYNRREPVVSQRSLARMRVSFDRVAARYARRALPE